MIAGVGDGNMTKPALDAITKAAAKGIVVVRSTRLPTGAVLRNAEVKDDDLGQSHPASSTRASRACSCSSR